MKKRLLSIILALCMALCLAPAAAFADDGDVAIDNTNFPDANFMAYVTQFDTNSDGILSAAEIAAVTSIDCRSTGIANLTGIEYFTALTLLNCSNNLLTSLDISKNTALIWFDCAQNKLTSLDIIKNTNLTSLGCDQNQLTSLDVSKNTALRHIYCQNNQLASLDVSKNTALTWLDCSQNQLTSLDLSANSSLSTLQLYSSSNIYTITLSESRTFDLSTLPGNFNTNLASNWNGGSVSEKFLTVDEGVDKITYTYDLGNGINETFTLNIPSHNHAYGAWSYNETNHWHECTDADCPDKTAGVKDTAAHVYDSDSDVDCNICGYVRTIKNTYDIIEGANSDWASTSGNTLTFRANGDFSKFTGVMIDGALLSTDNYTAVSGSTIITLKAEYLATLSVGTHTLTVVYNDGECGTSFTVKAKENTDNSTSTTTITATDKTNPSTGAIYGSAKAIQSESQNNAVILLAVITLAACGAVSGIVVLFIKKKKCNK